MSDFARSLVYNILGQSVSRVLSFGITMYFLRVVNNDVLGIVNVRLMLLYDTILFLTREPLRKANFQISSIPRFVNVVWLSPLICIATSIVCLLFWIFLASSNSNIPTWVLMSFPLSAFLESLAEPFVVYSLRFSMGSHFAVAQALLVILKRIFAFILIVWYGDTFYHLDVFAVAQIFGSIVFLLFNIIAFYRFSLISKPELSQFHSFRDFFPTPSEGFDDGFLKSVTSLFSHSILKQLLTSGSSYVMTFTTFLSLKDQAVFDAIEKLASLVARIVLAPLEENSYAEFSNQINKQSHVFGENTNAHDSLVKKFSTILHMVVVIGLVVCVFGMPYSKLAVSIYGGQLLADNGGAILLSFYAFYILIMAINGITECFAMASMNNKQVLSHGGFLFVTAFSHLALNVVFCLYFNSTGFIMANCVNMIIRIVYSWIHISKFLGKKTPSIIDDLMPSATTFIFLFFTLFAMMFSFLIFGNAQGLSHILAHVAIGGVMLLLVVYHIYHYDHTVQNVINGFHKPHTQ